MKKKIAGTLPLGNTTYGHHTHRKGQQSTQGDDDGGAGYDDGAAMNVTLEKLWGCKEGFFSPAVMAAHSQSRPPGARMRKRR